MAPTILAAGLAAGLPGLGRQGRSRGGRTRGQGRGRRGRKDKERGRCDGGAHGEASIGQVCQRCQVPVTVEADIDSPLWTLRLWTPCLSLYRPSLSAPSRAIDTYTPNRLSFLLERVLSFHLRQIGNHEYRKNQ